MPALAFDGVLFFPVTPFDRDDRVDTDVLVEHLETRLAHAPGGVFPACGTGEYHALSPDEADLVVRTTVTAVAGRVPVVAGTGGSVESSRRMARRAADAGADALLVLPPYLVGGSQAGLIRYVETIADEGLPVIVYHRGTAQYTADTLRRLFDDPRVIGFKDGVGDVALAQQVSLIAEESGREDLHLFNGLLTAELTQAAYRGLGIPLYSSAAFAMIPEVASLHYRAIESGDEALRRTLLREFYVPLVRLRDETPGFGVALIKAGIRLGGLEVGGVRPPLTDPSDEQSRRLGEILDAGRRVVEAASA